MKNSKIFILNKAKKCLKNYKDDHSIYYDELKKTYDEYRSSKKLSLEEENLYIEHINELCLYIKGRSKYDVLSLSLLFLSFFVLIFASVFACRSIQNTDKLNDMIAMYNKNSSITIDFKTTSNFDLSRPLNADEIKNIEPAIVKITGNSNDENYMIPYQVYLVSKPNSTLNADALSFSVQVDDKEVGTNKIANVMHEDGKILLYSGSIKSNETSKIGVKLWINELTELNYLNKMFFYNISIESK